MSQSITAKNSEQIEADICKRLESYRLMKNVSQADLARRAGVSRRTISRMENGHGVSFNTFIRVMRAFDLTSHLDALVPITNVRPIDRVNRKRERKNASSPRKNNRPSNPRWKWGDE